MTLLHAATAQNMIVCPYTGQLADSEVCEQCLLACIVRVLGEVQKCEK